MFLIQQMFPHGSKNPSNPGNICGFVFRGSWEDWGRGTSRDRAGDGSCKREGAGKVLGKGASFPSLLIGHGRDGAPELQKRCTSHIPQVTVSQGGKLHSYRDATSVSAQGRASLPTRQTLGGCMSGGWVASLLGEAPAGSSHGRTSMPLPSTEGEGLSL